MIIRGGKTAIKGSKPSAASLNWAEPVQCGHGSERSGAGRVQADAGGVCAGALREGGQKRSLAEGERDVCAGGGWRGGGSLVFLNHEQLSMNISWWNGRLSVVGLTTLVVCCLCGDLGEHGQWSSRASLCVRRVRAACNVALGPVRLTTTLGCQAL